MAIYESSSSSATTTTSRLFRKLVSSSLRVGVEPRAASWTAVVVGLLMYYAATTNFPVRREDETDTSSRSISVRTALPYAVAALRRSLDPQRWQYTQRLVAFVRRFLRSWHRRRPIPDEDTDEITTASSLTSATRVSTAIQVSSAAGRASYNEDFDDDEEDSDEENIDPRHHHTYSMTKTPQTMEQTVYKLRKVISLSSSSSSANSTHLS